MKQSEIEKVITNTDGSVEKPSNIFQLAWRVLLLDENVYSAIHKAEAPFRKGLKILMTVLLIIGAAQSVGLVFDVLTTPRIGLIQDAILQALSEMVWFERALSEVPDFANSFSQIYKLIWQGLRITGDLPSWMGTVTSFLFILVFSLLGWLAYGSVAYLIARWLGSKVSISQILGILALAYSPKLLPIFNLVPGLTVPGSLVNGWLLLTKYQAVKHTLSFSWKRCLVVVLIPYVIIGVLLFGIVLFGSAFALSSIPGFDPLLQIFFGRLV